MGLISNTIEIKVSKNTYKYYESLGYKIPKKLNNNNKLVTDESKYITVKTKDLPKGSHTKVKIRCDNPNCNKEYEVMYEYYIRQNNDGKTYCKSCVKKVLYSKENAYNWNPNLTDEERIIRRNTSEKTEFVKKALIRDNYTCQCCNKSLNHDGVVHHLNGWDNFKEQRYDVQNGITLCETCHKNFHSKYGYGNNTKEQFEEWYGEAVELVKYEGELPTVRKVYCIEEDKVYNSVKELYEEWNLKSISFPYMVCNGEYKVLKGKHLLWYDNYIKMTKEELEKFVINNISKRRRKVICITTGDIFNSVKEAGMHFNMKYYSSISECCNGKYSYTGKLPDGTRLKWMYYEDYIEQNKLKEKSC